MVTVKDFFQLKINPWGLILAVGTMTSVITVASFLGEWWWPLEIASGFRWQFAVLLTLVSLVCFAGRKILPALVFLILGAVNWIEMVPLYLAAEPVKVSREAPKLRCLLLSVKCSQLQTEAVKTFIRSTHADVVVLMDLDDAWERVTESMVGDYPHSITSPREDAYGVGLLSKLRMSHAESFVSGTALIPTLYVIVQCGAKELVILGTRLQPPAADEDHDSRIDQLVNLGRDFSDPPSRLILLGDLNVTHWSPYFKEFKKKAGLLDSAIGFGVQPTWPVNGYGLRIPVDHCLVSPGFRVVSRTLGPNIGSDHFPLIVDLEVRD